MNGLLVNLTTANPRYTFISQGSFGASSVEYYWIRVFTVKQPISTKVMFVPGERWSRNYISSASAKPWAQRHLYSGAHLNVAFSFFLRGSVGNGRLTTSLFRIEKLEYASSLRTCLYSNRVPLRPHDPKCDAKNPVSCQNAKRHRPQGGAYQHEQIQ